MANGVPSSRDIEYGAILQNMAGGGSDERLYSCSDVSVRHVLPFIASCPETPTPVPMLLFVGAVGSELPSVATKSSKKYSASFAIPSMKSLRSARCHSHLIR